MPTWPTQDYNMTGTSTQNAANTFIPIIWSDEVLATREANLVAGSFFKRVNHKGKAGDTIRMPFISDFHTHDKSLQTPVTIQVNAEGFKAISLDKHKEVSFMLEDFLKVQSSYDLRSEYTKKAGYALAKTLDTDILALFDAGLGTGYKVIGSDGTTAYSANNHASITDVGLRKCIQLLDDNNVPMNNRALIIPPSQKNALLGIDKFTLYQNIGRTSELQNGKFGTIYGIEVLVSTNCPTKDTGRVAVLAHKDAVCAAIQQDVRTQAQYQQEYLATLVTLDMIYGVKALRLDADDVSASNNRISHAVGIYVP